MVSPSVISYTKEQSAGLYGRFSYFWLFESSRTDFIVSAPVYSFTRKGFTFPRPLEFADGCFPDFTHSDR